jgi:hypothetical protein
VSPSGASEWTDLFVAAAGASAALTGLVFVAVSINIQEILRLPGVPDRALATLMLLLAAVVISLLPLIPDQSDTALGLELVLVGLAFIAVIGVTGARSFQRADNPAVRVELVVLAALGTVPYVIGGVLVLADADGGLYWVIGGVIGAIVGAVLNAWVLLVEILR